MIDEAAKALMGGQIENGGKVNVVATALRRGTPAAFDRQAVSAQRDERVDGAIDDLKQHHRLDRTIGARLRGTGRIIRYTGSQPRSLGQRDMAPRKLDEADIVRRPTDFRSGSQKIRGAAPDDEEQAEKTQLRPR